MDALKSKINAQDAVLNQKLQEAKQGIDKQDPEKLKEAAKNFEAIFINYMLQNMRKTVMKSGLLDEGFGGEIMMSMFDQKLSEHSAGQSTLGIADILVKQLSTDLEDISTQPDDRQSIPLKSEKLGNFHKINKTYLDSLNSNNLSRFDQYIENAAETHGLDSNLIRSVIMAESNGNPDAVSNKNARGLMQLIDSTASDMGVKNSLDPEDNIMGGSKYLSYLLNRFDGDTQKALAAYNAGPGKVDKYNGIPPYKETRQYVNRVMAYYRKLTGSDQDLASLE